MNRILVRNHCQEDESLTKTDSQSFKTTGTLMIIQSVESFIVVHSDALHFHS